ncbi:MAG: hypothetical protein D6769_00745 [Methanobacteriota archaeon]|nr:MAG: hypothetical protein D6769_00745 [Euryarchaeota archaeon]
MLIYASRTRRTKGKVLGENMKDELAELEEFEEVEKVGVSEKKEGNNMQQEQGSQGQAQRKGSRPDYRVLQPDTDANGKSMLRSVGAMWKSTTKDGREFYVMKIGELRLLVFPNNKQ